MGTERTLQLLVGATTILALLFLIAPLSSRFTPIHASFLLGVAYLAVGEYLITRQRIVRRFLSESLVDGTFLVFGLIALMTMLVG
jgi:hypothetical protein